MYACYECGEEFGNLVVEGDDTYCPICGSDDIMEINGDDDFFTNDEDD